MSILEKSNTFPFFCFLFNKRNFDSMKGIKPQGKPRGIP